MKKNRYIGLITTYQESSQGWLGDYCCEEKHPKRITTWCIPKIIATLATEDDVRFYWPYNNDDLPGKIKTRLSDMIVEIDKQVDLVFHTAKLTGQQIRLNNPPILRKRKLYFVHTRSARLFTLYAER